MKLATRIATLTLAATALSGCQSVSNFFSFGGKGEEQPTRATANPFGADELERGRMALKAGYPARAIEQFRLAALNEEVAPDAFNGMAVAYTKLGRADLAERYFKTAMTLQPSNPRYAANLTRFYGSPLGQSQRALAEREAKAEAALADAGKTAVSHGLIESPQRVQRIGAATVEPRKPLRVTRSDNREIRLATQADAPQSANRVAVVTVRRPARQPAIDPVTEAVEEATVEAVERQPRSRSISMGGQGREPQTGATVINVGKPGMPGVTSLRPRSYPLRVTLYPIPSPE